MGLFGSSKITLPPIPTFFSDPYVGKSESSLYGTGTALLANRVEDLPEILRDVVSTNPEVTKQVLEGLRAQLEPSYRNSRQNVISELEANNQLTGSTTASALGNLETDYLSGLTSAGANAAVNDINRAMAARLNLYSTGLGAVEASGRLGLSNQEQRNNFNLSNYENEVAQTLAGKGNQSGGILGSILGGLGGAAAGFALAPFTGGASLMAMAPTILGGLGGAVSGGLGPAGTGGSIFTAGAGLAGSRVGSRTNPFTLSSGAGESIFDRLGADNGRLSGNDFGQLLLGGLKK